MGIDINGIKSFNLLNNKKGHLGTVITLGRQGVYLDKKRILKEIKNSKIGKEKIKNFKSGPNVSYAENLIELYGVENVDSLDYSNYEGAKFVWDMNIPIPENLKNKYDLVFDGGTLEHVFNFPVAIKNAIEMLNPEGYFIPVACCNNLVGHGFYQFSPELFFKIFSKENGFKGCDIYIAVNNRFTTKSVWYKVKDPKYIKERIVFKNYKRTEIVVLAQRNKEKLKVDNFNKIYQSDYMEIWNSKKVLKNKQKNYSIKKLIKFMKTKILNLFLNHSINFNYKFFSRFDYRYDR